MSQKAKNCKVKITQFHKSPKKFVHLQTIHKNARKLERKKNKRMA